EAALRAAAGENLAGVVSPSVAELIRPAATAWLSKSKVAIAILLVAGLLSGAGAWTYRPSVASALARPFQPAEPPAAELAEKSKAASPKPEAAKPLKIEGSVLGRDGKPKAGVKLLLLGHDGAVKQVGVSAAD